MTLPVGGYKMKAEIYSGGAFLKTAAIIAEYNPFHNGHAYHIEQTRRAGATHIMVVMSGSFVQRGEPAMQTKFARAHTALECGADLVVELPVPWSMANAQTFARGAVGIIRASGCADMLSFGSECGDVSLLELAAAADSDSRVKELLGGFLAEGMTFAAAREKAVLAVYPELCNVLSGSNNALAVEYIKALENCGITPFTVKRSGAHHDSDDSSLGFASASKIRKAVYAGADCSQYMPETATDFLQECIKDGTAPIKTARLEKAVLYAMRCATPEAIKKAPDVFEGLENRIFEAARNAATLDELYALAKTRRYTHARIRRIVMSCFLGIKAQDGAGKPPYIRPLAFNGRGRELLGIISENNAEVLMRSSEVRNMSDEAKRVFFLECRATDIAALGMPQPIPCASDMTAKMIVE